MIKILVVEDEKDLNKMICDYLKTLDYQTESSFDGFTTLDLIAKESYNLILLDIMMPGIDGFDVLKSIRKKSNVPVIVVTAKVEENDKILGLEYGADDYITKPFSFRELAARIKAVLRRSSLAEIKEDNSNVIKYGEIILEKNKKKLYINNNIKDITALQYKIFEKLLENPGIVFSRKDILELLGEVESESSERNIDAHIKNLRKIIGKNTNEEDFIETVRGIGYRLKEII